MYTNEQEKVKRDSEGNVENYYKDPEPWKHLPKPKKQWALLKILLTIVICFLIVHIGMKLHGYNWDDFGFVKVLRQIIQGDYPISKAPIK